MLHEETGDANAKAVTAMLLSAVKARPPNCVGLIISDGTEGEEDEAEE